MYAVVVTDEGGVQRRLDFSKPELTVGRVQGNDIVLAKRNVSKQHARLTLEAERAIVTDLNSTNGTWVNGRRISSPYPIKLGDKIYIADFIITLEPANDAEPVSSVPPEVPDAAQIPTDVPPAPATSRPGRTAVPPRTVQPSPTASLPPRVERRQTEEASPRVGAKPGDTLGTLMARLAERIDLSDTNPESMQKQGRWSAARAAIAETFLAMQNDGSVDADADMREIAHIALHEAVGLGALDDVLSNESVRMLVVHGPKRILIDTGDGLRGTALSFSSKDALMTVARRLVAQAGGALTGNLFHGRLSFGPSLTILEEPLVSHGPVIEVRMGRQATLDALASDGWIGAEGASYLAKAVSESRNIVVAGPQGAGVTTLLSALARELPQDESTVAVELTPDLQIDRTTTISLSVGTLGLPMADAIALGAGLRSEHLVIDDLAGASLATALSTISAREPGHLLGVRCACEPNAIASMVAAAGCDGADPQSLSQMIATAVDVIVTVGTRGEGARVSAIYEIEGYEADEVGYKSIAT